MISREQLLEVGFTAEAIKHRLRSGRLYRTYRGVYAVGTPELTRNGRLMAAVLVCGEVAVLSHASAAALWSLSTQPRQDIEISIPPGRASDQPGIRVHRATRLADADVTRHHNIPVTTPVRTLIDLSTQLSASRIERAINEADKLDLVDPEALRAELDRRKGQRGVPALREVLDRATFVLTDSDLERRFLRIARRAGLPTPRTQQHVNGHRVDFYWPELGLVVETDGLRYHRTPAQQKSDRIRDQAHAAAGLTPLRFTHHQVYYESKRVEYVLAAVARQPTPRPPEL